MGKFKVLEQGERWYPLGMTAENKTVHWSVAAQGQNLSLLLFRKGEEQPAWSYAFRKKDRQGDVWNLTLEGDDFSGLEYCLELDGKACADPWGRSFIGAEVWGQLENGGKVLRTPVEQETFDWQGDRPLEIPYEETVIYRVHTRGLTMHPSSKVKAKGTFAGIVEKLGYIRELGATAIELMPVNEFQEVMMPDHGAGNPYGQDRPTGKLNYWGYGPAYYFAPKASYAGGNNPVVEFKKLVKEAHKSGLELIVELYFTGAENPGFVLEAVRFWAEEFHVDGIHLVGPVNGDLIGRDPYLSRTKLICTSWGDTPKGTVKHLGECNDGFMIDMRRVLKGDEDQLNQLIFRTRRNPDQAGVINYMANTNGFTMMDMVSYDTKHNETNGENNQDGNSYNFSWNCGVEGATKRKKIMELRKKQLRNGWLLLLLSQGTPLILSGDEFGNSQGGNNNAYCQDNEVSWLNWNQIRQNRELYEFVKKTIGFRKAHPVFHMNKEPRIMDYMALGQPDVSYHGVRAWCPEFDNFRRQLGIMYCGQYGKKKDGSCDNSFYVAYNMHWEPHQFDLPNLSKGQKWHVVYNKDAKEVNGMYEEGKEVLVEERQFMVPARTIVVFMGK